MRFEIPEPCDEDWARMRPTREGRFCERCQHGVVDLTRMTRRQAERRMRAVEGDYLCVQLAVDPEARPLFRPEPKRAPHWAGGLVLLAALTGGGCTRSEPEATPAAQLEPEPCPLDGPPMMPVDEGPMSPLDAAPPATGPVSTDTIEEGEVEPTEEQRALTEDKERRTRIRHVRGRIAISH